MYAIAKSGGKQFKIQPDVVIRVPSLSSNVGEKVKLEEILLVSDGDKILVGTPLVGGAYAEATVVCHGKDKKIKIIKYKRRKGYRRTLGHRQGFTELEISKIILGAPKAKKAEAPKQTDKAKQAPVAKAAPAKAAAVPGKTAAAKSAKKPAAQVKKDDKPAKPKKAAVGKDAKAKKPAVKAAKKPAAKKAQKPAEKAAKKPTPKKAGKTTDKAAKKTGKSDDSGKA